MILTYFLPIAAMIFTYARIGLKLWGSQSIGENTAGQLESIRSKRRVSSIFTKSYILVETLVNCQQRLIKNSKPQLLSKKISLQSSTQKEILYNLLIENT